MKGELVTWSQVCRAARSITEPVDGRKIPLYRFFSVWALKNLPDGFQTKNIKEYSEKENGALCKRRVGNGADSGGRCILQHPLFDNNSTHSLETQTLLSIHVDLKWTQTTFHPLHSSWTLTATVWSFIVSSGSPVPDVADKVWVIHLQLLRRRILSKVLWWTMKTYAKLGMRNAILYFTTTKKGRNRKQKQGELSELNIFKCAVNCRTCSSILELQNVWFQMLV